MDKYYFENTEKILLFMKTQYYYIYKEEVDGAFKEIETANKVMNIDLGGIPKHKNGMPMAVPVDLEKLKRGK
jgi:hypothetical protein